MPTTGTKNQTAPGVTCQQLELKKTKFPKIVIWPTTTGCNRREIATMQLYDCPHPPPSLSPSFIPSTHLPPSFLPSLHPPPSPHFIVASRPVISQFLFSVNLRASVDRQYCRAKSHQTKGQFNCAKHPRIGTLKRFCTEGWFTQELWLGLGLGVRVWVGDGGGEGRGGEGRGSAA